MEITADSSLPFPRAHVFAAYRDRLPELVPFLPNVRRIEVKSRTEAPPVVELVNVWHGGGEIPAAARALLSEHMLSWTDHARWDEGSYTCAFRTVTHAFPEAVSSEGESRFLEDGGGTRLSMRVRLRVDLSKIRGVPRLLAGASGRAVEQFLAAQIRPNLLEVSEGLRRYLSARQGAPQPPP